MTSLPIIHSFIDCAKSLQGEAPAPCGSAVYGSWTEMSPAPSPSVGPPLPLYGIPSPHGTPPAGGGNPPPEADPPLDSMTGGRQGRIDEQGRIDDITDATRDLS